jgi:hypothetical protein
MNSVDEKQKLIDLCFDIALTLTSIPMCIDMTTKERANWVARQLRLHGYDTEKVGSSWGVLKK